MARKLQEEALGLLHFVLANILLARFQHRQPREAPTLIHHYHQGQIYAIALLSVIPVGFTLSKRQHEPLPFKNTSWKESNHLYKHRV